MNRPNGSRTRVCPWCGQRYQFTNWMSRRNQRTIDGKLLRDTHQIACYRRTQVAK